MRSKFQDIERIIDERMSKTFQKLNERCQNHPIEVLNMKTIV